MFSLYMDIPILLFTLSIKFKGSSYLWSRFTKNMNGDKGNAHSSKNVRVKVLAAAKLLMFFWAPIPYHNPKQHQCIYSVLCHSYLQCAKSSTGYNFNINIYTSLHSLHTVSTFFFIYLLSQRTAGSE